MQIGFSNGVGRPITLPSASSKPIPPSKSPQFKGTYLVEVDEKYLPMGLTPETFVDHVCTAFDAAPADLSGLDTFTELVLRAITTYLKDNTPGFTGELTLGVYRETPEAQPQLAVYTNDDQEQTLDRIDTWPEGSPFSGHVTSIIKVRATTPILN